MKKVVEISHRVLGRGHGAHGVAAGQSHAVDKWFPPAYEKYAADGKPIAVAVYQFRNDTGLWPKYMDDLVPKYLPHARAGGASSLIRERRS